MPFRALIGAGTPASGKRSGTDLRRSFRDEAVLTLPKKTVTARNAAQRAYLETLRNHEMVFSVGPAGTGKTYLAVAMAVHMLNARRVRRIILTRPAVEAGEKLGFLPGNLAEKVNPYLRPLHDALLDMLGPQKIGVSARNRHHRSRSAGLHAGPHPE
ncbi:MAG: PhoH family protein [Bilophila sp.]